MLIRNAVRAGAFGAFILFAPLQSHAVDLGSYTKVVASSVQAVVSGKVEDVAPLVTQQDAAIDLGVAACREFAAKNPEWAKLLNHVVSSVPKMKQMTAEKLEEVWGDEGTAGDEIGVPLAKIDQFEMVRNYLDLVVHPARARAIFLEFQKTKSKGLIDEAKAELIEVLEHAKKIEAGKS